MYKLSAFDVEDISFALTKGATHYCSHCGQMYPEAVLQDVWSRVKGFYGEPFSSRSPICNTCVDHLLFVEGSIKKENGVLQFKSMQELEEQVFLSKGGMAQ